MIDAIGRRNQGWKAGRVERYAEPINQSAVLGQAIGNNTLVAVECPVCGRAAWPLNSATMFAHVRIERGPRDAGFSDVCQLGQRELITMIRIELDGKGLDERYPSGRVLDADGNVIGDAHSCTYGGTAFAVHTRAWGGWVPFCECEFVGQMELSLGGGERQGS